MEPGPLGPGLGEFLRRSLLGDSVNRGNRSSLALRASTLDLCVYKKQLLRIVTLFTKSIDSLVSCGHCHIMSKPSGFAAKG